MISSDSDIGNPANPFVTFRHFADEQLSYIWQSVLGFPSHSTASSSVLRAASDDYNWLQEGHRQRQAESVEAAKICNLLQKASEEGEMSVHEELDTLRCPYKPTDQELPQPEKASLSRLVWLDRREEDLLERCWNVCAFPEEFDGFHDPPPVHSAADHCPLLRWDRQKPLQNRGKLRYAFEDILREISTSEKDEDERRQSWLHSMLEREFFGNDWRRMYQERWECEMLPAMSRDADTKIPDNDAGVDEVTELDLYERFLGAQNSSFVQSGTEPSSIIPTSKNEKLDILSTLTTTERRKLPDGSIHTKVVLKKRFSDGREESTEIVRTANGSQKEQPKPISPADTVTNEATSKSASNVGGKETDSKSGWFWS